MTVATGVGKGNYPSNSLPKGKKVYPSELVEAVRLLYVERVMTMHEVATGLGLTPHVVERVMANHNIPSRPATPRNQRGDMNGGWKGEAAGYQALHLRVAAVRGTPKMCEECGTTNASGYEWASTSRDYSDPMDYRRLCRSCHRKMDGAARNIRGN